MYGLGFNVAPGGNPTGIGDYGTTMDGNGIPATILASDTTTGISDVLSEISAGSTTRHALVFRPGAGTSLDVPQYGAPIDGAADQWVAAALALIPPEFSTFKDHIWIQVGNEMDRAQADWIGNWSVAVAQRMNALGWKVLCFNWYSGGPEYSDWMTDGSVSYLEYCAANPAMAGVGLHEYSLDTGSILTGSGYLVGRYEFLYEVCDVELGIPRPFVVMTEFGWAEDDVPDPTTAISHLDMLKAEYPDYPPAAIWTLGPWHGNLPDAAQRLIVPITGWNTSNAEPLPPPTPPVEPRQYERVIHLIPQDMTESEMDVVMAEAVPSRQSITFSADDAFINHPNLTKRTVHVWDVNRVGGSQQELEDWIEAHYPPLPDALIYKSFSVTPPPPPPPPAPIDIDDIVDDLPKHPTKVYGTRQLSAIKYATVHHTVTPLTTTPETIANYHVNSNDWPGIGYHFLIRADGHIFQTNRLETVSYHDAKNTESVGIAMIGDFTSTPPSDPQLGAASSLLEYLGTVLTGIAPRRHNEVGQTACPGSTWPQWWDELIGVEPPQLPPHLDVVPLSQRDSAWADVTLGQPTGHGQTIGGFGCLYVDYYMMAVFLGVEDRDLLTAHAHFVAGGAFSAQYLKPGALAIAYPDTVAYKGWRAREDPLMEPVIRAYVDDGVPVAARVDFVPTTSAREQHWVLIIGYDGDDYVVVDPWVGQKRMLSEAYPISGVDVLEAVYYRPKSPAPQPTGQAGIGLHARANPGDMRAADIGAFTTMRPEIGKVLHDHNPDHVAAWAAAIPPSNPLVIRVHYSFQHDGGPGGRLVTPDQIVNDTKNEIIACLSKLPDTRPVWLEVHNEPNLVAEGWTGGGPTGTGSGSWSSATGFAVWIDSVLSRYESVLPSRVKYLYPGLSPGETVPGVRSDHRQWLSDNAAIIGMFDGLGVHAYWTSGVDPMENALAVVDDAATRFPGKPIIVTEASEKSGISPATKAQQYLNFWQGLKQRPSVVGVTYFVVSASNDAFAVERWVDEAGVSLGIAEAVGARR